MRYGGFSERVESNQPTSIRYVKKRQEVNVLPVLLDQYSTSATYPADLCFSNEEPPPKICTYNAPFFAYNRHDKTYSVTQGCCNHWACPRCGLIRAKQEYWRIVEGTKALSEHDELWFITITSRGREITPKEADDGYGEWCKLLMDSWRLQAKRTGKKWAYVSVTERQKRGHPHSHILTTFCPNDLKTDWKLSRVHLVDGRFGMRYVGAYRSDYLKNSCIRSGLGAQYDITSPRTIQGVARYVAKYLFKDTIFDTVWPKGWKRVRYSQSFPKQPRDQTDAFALIRKSDWQKLSRLAVIVKTDSEICTEEANFWLKGSDTIVLAK